MKGIIAQRRKKLSGILFLLNERQRRPLVASEALALGYGGVKTLSEITGISCPTIRRGIKELKANNKKFKGIRANGGGRKKATDNDPDLVKILEEIIEPDTRGDPELALRWTCKSVRNIADLLKKTRIQR
jgi:Rhodopirellula transposase DDE domain